MKKKKSKFLALLFRFLRKGISHTKLKNNIEKRLEIQKIKIDKKFNRGGIGLLRRKNLKKGMKEKEEHQDMINDDI